MSNLEDQSGTTPNAKDWESPVYVSISEERFIEYIIEKAAKAADEREEQRDKKWRAIFTVIFAALTAFGFKTIGDLKDDLQKGMKLDIEAELRSKLPDVVSSYYSAHRNDITIDMEKKLAEADARLAFISFLALAEKMDEKSSFTVSERDSIFEFIAEIKKSPSLLARPDFQDAVSKIINSLVAADQESELDRLDKMFRENFERNQKIVLSMVQHYGIRVVSDMVTEKNSPSLEVFDRYARITEYDNSTPEATYPFRLAIAFLTKDSQKAVLLFSEIAGFKHPENSLAIIDAFADADDSELEAPKLKRVQKVFIDIKKNYKAEFSKLNEDIPALKERGTQNKSLESIIEEFKKGLKNNDI